MKPPEISSISKETAEHYMWGERCDGWHLLKSRELSVIEERMPPGTAEVRHFHRRAQQFFYVLSGTAVMEVGGQALTLNTGEGIWIPVETPHQLRNDSDQETRFLVVSQPQSHGDRELV